MTARQPVRARMRPDRALVVLSADTCYDGEPLDDRPYRTHLVRDGGGRLCGGRLMRSPRLADSDVPTCTACRALFDRAHEALATRGD